MDLTLTVLQIVIHLAGFKQKKTNPKKQRKNLLLNFWISLSMLQYRRAPESLSLVRDTKCPHQAHGSDLNWRILGLESSSLCTHWNSQINCLLSHGLKFIHWSKTVSETIICYSYFVLQQILIQNKPAVQHQVFLPSSNRSGIVKLYLQ